MASKRLTTDNGLATGTVALQLLLRAGISHVGLRPGDSAGPYAKHHTRSGCIWVRTLLSLTHGSMRLRADRQEDSPLLPTSLPLRKALRKMAAAASTRIPHAILYVSWKHAAAVPARSVRRPHGA